MLGDDGLSTATILALLSIAVPSAITVIGFVFHAAFVAGRLTGLKE